MGAYSDMEKVQAEDLRVYEEARKSDEVLDMKPVKVSRQVVAGMNYRFLVKAKDGSEHIVTIFSPLPGRGDPRMTSLDEKEVTFSPLRYIIYYEDEKARENLLEIAQERGDEVLYKYQNFNAIAIKITSSATEENAVRNYSNLPGVVSMIKDGVVNLDPIEKPKTESI